MKSTYIVSYINFGILHIKKVKAVDPEHAQGAGQNSVVLIPEVGFKPFTFVVAIWKNGILSSKQVWTCEDSWEQALHQVGYSAPMFSKNIENARKLALNNGWQFDVIHLNKSDLADTMKKIQSMPDIWDYTPFTTSRSAVLGAFVAAAVRQSPYLCPTNIALGLSEFNGGICDDYFKTNCHELQHLVREIIEKCPTVQGWNVPKKGKHTTLFCSRYTQPQPDYDFIDLDAMARNIAHAVTLEEKYSGLHE